MANMKITITDDGGKIEGRVRTLLGEEGERFAFVSIGALDLSIAGYDEAAAERCHAIALAFHQVAVALLRPAPALGDALKKQNAEALEALSGPPRELSAAEAVDAAGEALSSIEFTDRAGRKFQARKAPAGEGPRS